MRFIGPLRGSRPLRYCYASAIAVVLAQLALALAYGVFHWAPAPAVALSLAVSVGPAYILYRRRVWPEAADRRGRVPTFLLAAVAGTVIASVTTSLADSVGRSITHDHVILTLVVNITAFATMVAVWVARYVFFDRYLFNRSPELARRGA